MPPLFLETSPRPPHAASFPRLSLASRWSVVAVCFDPEQLVRPLLRFVERRIEQREVRWGHRRLLAYVHRTGVDECRPFATLAGIR